ncbi:MAG: GIY-YIG nuclease family protein [Coriobacteriia bacterium]|nr:GIY-YIG nuclease family protein [Coriobacteriia bacterium]
MDIGFNRVGDWRLVEGRLVFKLDTATTSANVLYAFISGEGQVFYIGKTTQTLPKRLMGYQRPGPSQVTNIRNNIEIKILLALERHVEIYALADTGLLRFGEFTINLAAGLEDALISELKPAWNCR